MRIGIDIDDTITETWKTLAPIYSQKFNIPIETLKNSRPYYRTIKEYITLEEYFKMMRELEYVIKDVPIKKEAIKVINKLKNDGYTIIFITARGNDLEDPYKTTKEYLDKHSISYDKLIVNALDKGKVSIEEKLDLFIDDSLRHCDAVSSNGIEVLMMETSYNKKDKEFHHVKDWNEIYEYINNR